jgi:endoglycosylceramidase
VLKNTSVPRVAAAAVALVLLAYGGGATAASAPRHDSTRLHVDGATVRDAAGRQVLLRGIQVIDKEAPYVPRVTAADFRRIRSWGLDSVRLGLLWSGVMPRRGQVDPRYVAAIARLARQAADAGLYVVLDMHQDVYGVPWGDGAPAWAGQTACPYVPVGPVTGAWALDYLSPAVLCAFTQFWTDPALQAEYTTAWTAVARAVRDNARIAGYDLINEPSQGLLPPGVFESQYLYPSQARWLAAIQAVDRHAIGMFEVPNYRNVEVPDAPPTGLPPQAVFAPHNYGLWDDAEQLSATRPLADANAAWAAGQARAVGRPLWTGEFGVVASSPGATEFVRHVFDLADQDLAGLSYWEYQGGYAPTEPDGRPRPLLAALVRSYPVATAGDLGSVAWDSVHRTLTVTWTQRGSGASVLAVPLALFPHGVRITGARPLGAPSAGQLRVSARPGPVHLTVTPAR